MSRVLLLVGGLCIVLIGEFNDKFSGVCLATKDVWTGWCIELWIIGMFKWCCIWCCCCFFMQLKTIVFSFCQMKTLWTIAPPQKRIETPIRTLVTIAGVEWNWMKVYNIIPVGRRYDIKNFFKTIRIR